MVLSAQQGSVQIQGTYHLLPGFPAFRPFNKCFCIIMHIQVDNKPHPVPAAMTITHKDRWNVDKELHEYYADIEKRY